MTRRLGTHGLIMLCAVAVGSAGLTALYHPDLMNALGGNGTFGVFRVTYLF